MSDFGVSRGRNLQLDVLRGVAILLVFGRHFELPLPHGVAGILAQVWHRIGWLGVDLFFVLSGFLIGGLLLTELERHGRIDVPRFIIRRGLKLYPGYFLFIGYLMIMPAVREALQGGDVTAALARGWTQLWPNVVFLQNYLWSPAGHTWSLAVEEHFYLLLPVFLMLFRSQVSRVVVPGCLLAAPLVTCGLRALSILADDPFAGTMSATHLRIDALLFGVGLRALAQYCPSAFRITREWRWPLLLTGVLLWAPHAIWPPEGTLFRTLGLTGTFLGAAAFLMVAYHTRAADFGRWAWCIVPVASGLAWIGVYSYATYLWHITMFGFLERQIGALQWLPQSSQLAWMIGAVAMSAGAVMIGVVATRLVEAPILHIRDRFLPSRSIALPPVVAVAPRPIVRNSPVEAVQ